MECGMYSMWRGHVVHIQAEQHRGDKCALRHYSLHVTMCAGG